MTDEPINQNPEDRQAWLNAVASLQVLTKSLCKRTENHCPDSWPKGVTLHLERAYALLTQVHKLSTSGDKPLRKIGIFGPPKQGKSSLLNALLGVDILPTGRPPATTTLIYLEDTPQETKGNAKRQWVLDVMDPDFFVQSEYYDTPEELRGPLATYAARDLNFPDKPSPKQVRVSGPFHETSRVFEGAMLMDTPGAETAFEVDPSNVQLKRETARALEALQEANVTLFCARADNIGAGNTFSFYNNKMRRLAPLNIVNFLDVWLEDDGDKSQDPCSAACAAYGLPRDRTFAVSAKYAEDAGLNPAGRNAALWEKSRISELENRILEELERLKPVKAIREVMKTLEDLRERHADMPLRPLPLDGERFRKALADIALQGDEDVDPARKCLDNIMK